MPSDRVFVIAECGSCWRFGDDHLANAYRMIEAAKECGADAAKFQWTSDYKLMMARRVASPAEEEAYTFVQWPREWLPLLKAKCDEVGIEFMCTVFLPQDVSVISGLVKRFKVAARESQDKELRDAIRGAMLHDQCMIVSVNPGSFSVYDQPSDKADNLHCISKYPTKLEELKLDENLRLFGIEDYTEGWQNFNAGISDHSANVITGAVAVGAGARVIESHVRLHDTPAENPDYPHSLMMSEGYDFQEDESATYYGTYDYYVELIRTAERMM